MKVSRLVIVWDIFWLVWSIAFLIFDLAIGSLWWIAMLIIFGFWSWQLRSDLGRIEKYGWVSRGDKR